MSEMRLGAAVRRAREAAGLSRGALADRVAVSVDTILRLEVHEKLPASARLLRITRELGLTLTSDGALIEEAARANLPAMPPAGEGEATDAGLSTGESSPASVVHRRSVAA